MSEWKKVKFLDVVSLNPRVSLEKGAVYPFVEMSNAVPGARKPEKDVYQKYSGGGAKFEEGDTVVARIEPCLQNGKGFQCSYKKGFGSTEFLVFRPLNLKEMDCDYLYYYMGQQSIREAMAKTMVGASGRQRVNNAVFNDLQINLPPLNIQQEIASILSRYDTLIENYQKQIKLLEEAALRLYKEWFVELRFPGHENMKMVDGLPEGWEKKTLDEYCSVFTGKKNANAAVLLGKYKFFTCGDTPLQIDSFIYDGPAIIISGNGSYTGRTTFFEGKFDLYQRTYACTINNNDNRDLIYGLFEIVKCELTAQISGGTHGAAIPYIVMGDITKFTFSSNDIVLRKFSKIIKSFLDRTMCLSSQIRLLTEARDRLLPRLMGGEINVILKNYPAV